MKIIEKASIITLAVVILLPCFAILNDSDSILTNIFGFVYILLLKLLSFTKAWGWGKKKLIKAINEL